MQRFIADDWPAWFWVRVVPLTVPAFVWWVVVPLPWLLSDWPNWFLFAGLLALAWAFGWFAAILPGWMVLGPLYSFQAWRNGAPYRVGDCVRVLSRRERGRVARVYEVWAERGEVRLELGDAAREQVDDVFSDWEVCQEAQPPEETREGVVGSSGRNAG